MAKKKTDPNVTSAAEQATINYGPQETVLAQLLRDAETRRDTALQQAKSGRQYTVGAVNAAIPQVQSAYQTAGQAVTPGFVGGGGVEASALQARMGEAQAQATSQLDARRVGAVEGEQAARVQAQNNYSTDRGKVLASAQDLAGEKGAFTAKTISDLEAADAQAQADAAKTQAQLDNSRGNAWISAGVDPATGAPIPGGKLDPKAKGNGGAGWASNAVQTKASDVIGAARNEIQTLKASGASRADAAQLLLSGAPATKGEPVYETVKDPRTGKTKQQRVLNKDGTPKMTNGVPALEQVKSQLLLSAALDMEYLGHLSQHTQDLLHKRGIKLQPLDVTTLGQYQQSVRQPVSRPGNAPAQGGSRPT